MTALWAALMRRAKIGFLLLMLVALIGCSNPFARSSPFNQWGMSMVRDDYNDAQRFLVSADAAAWRVQTDQLRQQHGGVKSYQKGDLAPPPGSQKPIAMVRLTWDDGYVRCLRMQETGDSHIAIFDGGYQDCTTVATP